MILYLIRHGISMANEAQLVTGLPDDALSKNGLVQTKRLAHWLKDANLKVDRCITSQWRRAQQTANRLWPEKCWEIDTRVGETNAGQVSNWRLQDFESKFPTFSSSPGNIYPNGESHLDLNQRVLDWLYEQMHSPCNFMALVSHSGPISCILQHLIGMDMSAFPVFLPANASISVIKIYMRDKLLVGKIIMFSARPDLNLQQI